MLDSVDHAHPSGRRPRLRGLALAAGCLAALLAAAVMVAQSGTAAIGWQALSSGGTTSGAGGAIELSGTLGQAIPGSSSGGDIVMVAGFGAGTAPSTPTATPSPTATSPAAAISTPTPSPTATSAVSVNPPSGTPVFIPLTGKEPGT